MIFNIVFVIIFGLYFTNQYIIILEDLAGRHRTGEEYMVAH